MQREPGGPGSAGDWLRFAQSDLVLSRERLSEEVLLETLCFHAHTHYNFPVPRTHVIEALLDAVATRIEVPAEIRDAAGLTPYATAARYPGDYEPILEAEYLEAVAKAEQVVAWARIACGH